MPNSDTTSADAGTEAPATADPQGSNPQRATDPTSGANGPAADPTDSGSVAEQLVKANRERKRWEERAKRDQDTLRELREQLRAVITPEDAQRMQTDLATVQRELEAARLDATRFRVALAEGLPVDVAPRLVSGTEEELVADAKTLKGLVRPTRATPAADAGTAPGKTSQPNMSADEALRAALGIGPRA